MLKQLVRTLSIPISRSRRYCSILKHKLLLPVEQPIKTKVVHPSIVSAIFKIMNVDGKDILPYDEIVSTDSSDVLPPKSKNMIKRERRRDLGKRRKASIQDELCKHSQGEKRKPEELTKQFKSKQDAKRRKKLEVNQNIEKETSYYFENCLRKVYPYYFTFVTHAKGRWVDKTISAVFAKEFRLMAPGEFENRIKDGSISVNYDKVEPDYVVQHNDVITHVIHRHEVPVTDAPIKIVHVDDDLLVIDKPSSIPVHPSGRYRHNTIVTILAKDYNYKNLNTIHRLDRLTSGLLLFGRNKKKAAELSDLIQSRSVQKEYVCRVEGKFPEETIVCEEPIDVLSIKIGVCRVSPTGKDCKTEFKLLSYNGSSSVVMCKPLTGRMHQIRVHLQYLGYPIINDPLYNHSVFGLQKGKGGLIDKSTDELLVDLLKIHNCENWLGKDGKATHSCFIDTPVTETDDKHSTEEHVNTYNPELLTVDPKCNECKLNYRDPSATDLVMYLHAITYSGPGWSYSTERPYWAADDWKP